MTLEKTTRVALIDSGLTPEYIAARTLDTARPIRMKWVYDFRNDKSKDYGIRRVQRLADYLSRVK